MILHWSNLAFDREITLKRTKKVSSIISSKKILSQVTVSLKNGQRRVQIAQSAFFSLNIVNGSLGRDSALFVWCAERREKNSTLMKKAANPPAASDMKREDSPTQSLHLAAQVQYEKKHHLLLFEKDRYTNVKRRCNPKTLRCLSEIVVVTLTGSKSSFKVPTWGIAHANRWKSRCHGQKTNWIKIRIVWR